MDSDDDVPDTRIFVSGLPPKYTSEQLGAHFAGRYQITDAVVLPGRQIGFVGFRNYTLAKNAVKYFDKTYVRMSKISVSMARAVGTNRSDEGNTASILHADNTSRLGRVDDKSTATVRNVTGPSTTAFTSYVPVVKSMASNKRKREDDDGNNGKQSEALKEFLDVMQPSTKSTWVTENSAPQLAGSENSNESKKAKNKKHKEEESGQLLEIAAEKPKKRRKEKVEARSSGMNTEFENDKVRQKKSIQDKSSKSRDSAKGGVEALDEDAVEIEKDDTDTFQPSESKSDFDWLRTKTSRTLDLVEPHEVDIPTNLADKEEEGSTKDESDHEQPDTEEAVHSFPRADTVLVTNGRLFIRNLPFTTDEDDLRSTFSKYGKLTEVHVVRDFKTSISKGVAYLQYVEPEPAEKALRALDGKSFQGRLLHILPASDKKSNRLHEFELSKLPIKTQKSLKRKAEASTSTFSWNSLYMNPDAVLSSVADRLRIDKSELLDPTSSDAAVKQAFAETDVIQKTKDYLRENGVNVDVFQSRERDDQTVLLKNFPYGTTSEDLRILLDPFGEMTRFILPPTGTMAVVQYAEKHAASQALKRLAYKNIKGSVLFLEKGPRGLFEGVPSKSTIQSNSSVDIQVSATADGPELQSPDGAISSTVFVRNLNFSTTSARLAEVFGTLQGFLSARVKTRTDPKRPGEVLSMGFGFLEFATKSHAQSAIAAMSGYRLDDHELQVQISHKATDAADERRREDKAKKSAIQNTKIIIKNLPFEASKNDIRTLLGAYGQLRTVRVPKKFDNSTRGFAFAEFVSAREAQNAIEALSNTHLLGRRLVLDFAEGESVDAEAEIQAIEKKVGQQASMIHLNKVTGSARRKFNVDAREDADVLQASDL